jgi:hypothetical protein
MEYLATVGYVHRVSVGRMGVLVVWHGRMGIILALGL